MMYVTDTHSLIWFLTEDKSLSEKARLIFEKVDKGEGTIVIPTIVLAELIHICERKNVQEKFKNIIQKILNGANYLAYDLYMNIILECTKLKKIPDMHDKIITATAKILNALLITKDEEILNSGYIETIW